jgi:PBSX family phage terminase large subunit
LELLEKEIRVNDIYIPLIDNQSRFLPIYGGAGSGKSVFAAFKIVKRTVSESGHKFLCLRKVATTVKESVFAEIKGQISELDLDIEFLTNKTDHSFLHLPTGNMILCKGLDDPAKIKSIKGITGIWMEEATEFEEIDLDQLDLRIRGEKENYVQYILTFNPIDESHWLKKRFFDKKDPMATTCHSTYLDNHFLTVEDKERLESLKDRNQLYYDVYCLGKWGVTVKTNKFMYSFSLDKHVIESYQPTKHLPILISYDFNKEPMTATVSQQIDHLTSYLFDEIQLDSGSTPEVNEYIKAKYMHWLDNMDVTGDATGRNRTAMVRGNLNHYRIIKDDLNLLDRNLLVPSTNPAHKDSRMLCNSVLQHANFYITKNCVKAIEDCTYAAVDEMGELLKTAKEGRHILDNVRYTIHAYYKDFIKNPKKYKNAA